MMTYRNESIRREVSVSSAGVCVCLFLLVGAQDSLRLQLPWLRSLGLFIGYWTWAAWEGRLLISRCVPGPASRISAPRQPLTSLS